MAGLKTNWPVEVVCRAAVLAPIEVMRLVPSAAAALASLKPLAARSKICSAFEIQSTSAIP